MTEYTDFHIGPQAPVSALRQDLPYISFDPLGDVATIAVVEGGDGCQASAQLVDVATIAAVEDGDGCQAAASITLLDALLDGRKKAAYFSTDDFQAKPGPNGDVQQPKKTYFDYVDEAGVALSREVRLQYPDGRKKTWQEAADPDRPG